MSEKSKFLQAVTAVVISLIGAGVFAYVAISAFYTSPGLVLIADLGIVFCSMSVYINLKLLFRRQSN